MADISNVIQAALIPGGVAAARDNMNVCAVMTSNQDVLSSAERYRLYSTAAQVEADFGTASSMTKHAQVFFSQTPNPVQFGGVFVAGFWRGADETVDATAATLTGTQLSEASLLSELQTITDGSFAITVDGGVEEEITGLDFSAATSFSDVVTILDVITGATVTEDDQRFIVTSDTTGATSTLTYLSAAASGTFIGDLLTLSSGSGAVLTQGADSTVLTAETKVDAVSELISQVNVKGLTFIDDPTDTEAKNLATWSKANSVLIYDVFSSASNLTVDVSNVVWDIKLSGLDTYRSMYSKAGNRLLATARMARQHTVNFNAQNSAMTANLKQLNGVAAEEYTQTEITSAKTVGLDIYTTIKNVPVVLQSSANGFADNVYNLIGFIDAVQTDAFNVLATTGTKVPQTTEGVNTLVDQAEKTCSGFVRAGVFAPGTWTLTDYFGDIDVFNRNIESRGFYVLANSLADQPVADRQARKSPVIQVAVKNAGAIEQASFIINFNI